MQQLAECKKEHEVSTVIAQMTITKELGNLVILLKRTTRLAVKPKCLPALEVLPRSIGHSASILAMIDRIHRADAVLLFRCASLPRVKTTDHKYHLLEMSKQLN